MTIQWRDTLVLMETALQGQSSTGTTQLPLSMSENGYGLLSSLVSAGTTYDATGDDGATNTSSFTTLLNLYVSQAAPVFLELDRLARWIYSLYSITTAFTPQMAFDFGVINSTQLTNWLAFIATPAGTQLPTGAAIPTLTAPVALTFDYTGGNFTTLNTRVTDATSLATANLPGSASNLHVLALGNIAWGRGGVWWDNATPPVSHALTATPWPNPVTLAENTSSAATTAVETAVANCQSWLAAITFV